MAIIDADDAKPDVRQSCLKADPFITRGGRVIYLVKQSEVLAHARRDVDFFCYMLASIIWHEMAHMDGADEPEAQRREEGLWRRFLRDENVDRTRGLRYLHLMKERHDAR